MQRKPFAALLLLSACLVLFVTLMPVAQTVPATLRAQESGATVELSASDTTTLFSSDCVQARWNVSNIRAVELDERGVVGTGTLPSCDSSVDLQVTFRNGTSKVFSIPKQIRSDSAIQRVLIVGALFAFGLGIVLTGWPSMTGAALRRSPLHRAIDARLAPVPAVTDDRALTASIILGVTAIILIGGAARAWYLPKSLGFDETWTYTEFASQSPAFIVSDYQSTNNHILQSLLMWLSTQVFGLHPWSLRLSVFFTGLLVIAAVFALGRRFYGVRAGLLAAGLSAGASWLIEYSTNARGYSLTALVLLLLLLLASTLRRRSSTRRWLAFVLLGVVGLYTVPSMAYPLGLVCTWLGLSIVIENQGRERWHLLRDLSLSLLLMAVIVGLLYLPPYLYLRSHPRADAYSFEALSWGDLVDIYRREFSDVWSALTRDLALPVIGLLATGVVTATAFHQRITRSRIGLIGAGLLWLPSILFIQLVTTYDRLWLFLLPLFLIMAAGGLVFLWRLLARPYWPSVPFVTVAAVAIAALTTLGALRSNSVELSNREDRALGADTIVAWLRDHTPEHPPVLCAEHCHIFQVYGQIDGVPIVRLYEDAAPTAGPIYVVTKSVTPDIDLDDMMTHVNIPTEVFETPVLVTADRDAWLFRLDRRKE